MTEKFKVAQEILSAVAHNHIVEWVHKSIRSKNILLVWKHNEAGLGTANLVGYTFARRIDAQSRGTSDFNWQAQLYAHPSRLDVNVEKMINAAEEQATVTPAPASTLPQATAPPPAANSEDRRAIKLEAGGAIVNFTQIHAIYSVGVVLLELGLWQDLETVVNAEGEPTLSQASADERRNILKGLVGRLKPLMGKLYTKIVRECLNVEEGNDLCAAMF